MWQDGHSLLKEPYRGRRKKLEALKLKGAWWQTPPYEKGGGPAMLEASREAGLEGIMAKKLDSPYEPGKRSGAWIKVKNRMGQELVMAAGSRAKASAEDCRVLCSSALTTMAS